MNNMQYTLIVLVLLIGFHNWLMSSIEEIEQQLTSHKSLIPVSLALFIGTVLLMLLLAASKLLNGYGLLAIGFSLISSFLIISFFSSSLLREMKYQILWFKFFINPKLLLAILFIIATELLVLYWLKEVDIYIQQRFLGFVSGYAVLIILSGIFLAYQKRDDWRLNLIVIINPIIVVFLAFFILQILLTVFYKFI